MMGGRLAVHQTVSRARESRRGSLLSFGVGFAEISGFVAFHCELPGRRKLFGNSVEVRQHSIAHLPGICAGFSGSGNDDELSWEFTAFELMEVPLFFAVLTRAPHRCRTFVWI
ncbi:hypothetical protein K469DRAFT_703309 [Zopfia rhizophila CBS 207.26]|uniref:Uncharacterized protein n=1 Tax=Zopfia rhizophila CBS 207.26 TaxID=1314779 RepID=A0A6A6EA08_9PEZI|nr:hypothetical protein K469DRAFT_703309 [Zopfia rhizophila CBS 207.26]